MKQIEFYGSALVVIRAFPDAARREVGYQLDRVQNGLDPTDWKPMRSVGKGVREIRVMSAGQFRVIYSTGWTECIAVLHAFRKKTRKTAKADIIRAREAFREAAKK